MPTLTVSQALSISYKTAGQGSPLVFLHAFPLNSEMWSAQIEFFSSRYRVIAPDMRGIGETSAFTREPSILLLAQDLEALLHKMEIDEPVILAGLSLGGYVAMEYVHSFSERVKALILCDTRPDLDSPETKQTRDEMIAFARESDGSGVIEKMLPKLLSPETLSNAPEVKAAVQKIAADNEGLGLANLFTAIRDRRDSTDLLHEIHCPVLVLGGENDQPSPVDVMHDMANRIPNAKHVVIPKAGHLTNLEQTEIFNRELAHFLNQLES